MLVYREKGEAEQNDRSEPFEKKWTGLEHGSRTIPLRNRRFPLVVFSMVRGETLTPAGYRIPFL
jgi:hypothetical protein